MKPETVHIKNPPKAAWPCNEGKSCPVCGDGEQENNEKNHEKAGDPLVLDPRVRKMIEKILKKAEEAAARG
jgi:hypothetical protein